MQPSILLPLLGVLLTGTPFAQSPDGSFQPPSPDAVGVLHDVDADGILWSLGATYKASFAADGVQFIPFFGSEAPRNFPVEFALARATAGGAPISLVPDAPTTREGDVVAIHRGGLVEQYRLEPKGMEQMFRIDRLPSRGELRLEVAVRSELKMRADSGGLRFDGALGSVQMGRAIAIDAGGETIDVEMRPSEGGYTFVVPSAFMESAELPLWVDPVVSTINFQSSIYAQSQPDIAYLPDEESYTVTYESQFSSGDGDVFVDFYDIDGGFSFRTTVDFTGQDWCQPAIATNSRDNIFTVVASVDDQFPARRILARTWQNGAMAQARTVSDPSSTFDCAWPDVSGADSWGGNFVVAWEREESPGSLHTIRRTFLSFAGIVLANPTTVLSQPGVRYSKPRLSNSAGQSRLFGNWRVVLVATRFDDVSVSSVARVLNGLSASSVTGFFGLPAFGSEQSMPVASSLLDGPGSERLYAVAYTAQFSSDTDIALALMRGTTVVDTMNLSIEEGDFLRDETLPSITTDGNRFFVGYAHDIGGNNLQPHFAVVNVVGEELVLIEGRTRASTGSDIQAVGEIFLRGDSGREQTRAAFVWTGFDGLTDIRGAVLESQDAIQDGFGTACRALDTENGAPAWIAMTGSGSIGAPHQLTLMGMTANQFGYVLVSQTTASVTFPGGSAGRLCLGGDVGRMVDQVMGTGSDGWFAVNVDTLAVAQPTGSVSILPGQTWYFQGWFRDSGSSNFTDSVGAVFQ